MNWNFSLGLCLNNWWERVLLEKEASDNMGPQYAMKFIVKLTVRTVIKYVIVPICWIEMPELLRAAKAVSVYSSTAFVVRAFNLGYAFSLIKDFFLKATSTVTFDGWRGEACLFLNLSTCIWCFQRLSISLCCRLHSAGHLLDICMQNVGLSHLEPGKCYHFPDGYDIRTLTLSSYTLFSHLIYTGCSLYGSYSISMEVFVCPNHQSIRKTV